MKVELQKADYDKKILLTFPSGRTHYLWLASIQYAMLKDVVESEAKLQEELI